MKAKDVYALVSSRIQDLKEDRRWPWETPADDEAVSLERFLNNAMLTVAVQRPDATSTIKNFTLAAGPLQTLGATDLALLDCLYTLDSSDNPANVVTRINRQEMDAFSLSWPSASGGIYHWAYERIESPRNFWVLPGATAGDKIKVVMSEYPVTVSDPGDDLNITFLYQPALAELVLYQVLASDTDDTNWQNAQGCLQAAAQVMGIKLDSDINIPLKTRRSEAN